MSNQIAPKPAEAMERCMFHTAQQEPQETISEFIARLKKLALNCNFEKLDTVLRDQLVCGIRGKETRIRLFEEKALTFDKAKEIATTRETAMKNADTSNNLLEKTHTREEMYYTQASNQHSFGRRQYSKDLSQHNKYSTSKQRQTEGPLEVTCYCCGKQNHRAKECRFRNYNCNFCQKIGHLEKICRKKLANILQARRI